MSTRFRRFITRLRLWGSLTGRDFHGVRIGIVTAWNVACILEPDEEQESENLASVQRALDWARACSSTVPVAEVGE